MLLKNTDHDAVLVVAAIIYRQGEVALFRRGPGMTGAGHWEFPGGKVEVGESETQALVREISEELSVDIRPESFLGETVHQYPNKKIRLRFYWVSAPVASFGLTEHDQFRWVSPRDIDLQTLSEGDRPIVESIRLDPRFRS